VYKILIPTGKPVPEQVYLSDTNLDPLEFNNAFDAYSYAYDHGCRTFYLEDCNDGHKELFDVDNLLKNIK
jgi:hypothetical protein